MPRFHDNLIDIFRCSSAKFWVEKDPLSFDLSTLSESAKKDFICSLSLFTSSGVVLSTFETVTFSEQN